MESIINKFNSQEKEDHNNGRKLIRVHNEIHELAKWNRHKMDLSNYIESLIVFADINKVDFSIIKEVYVTRHEDEKKRTLVRVMPKYHKLAKFNSKEMQLQEYVENLIILDNQIGLDLHIALPSDSFVALNFKVEPQFRKAFRSYASEQDISMKDLLQRSFDFYKKNN